MTFRSHLEKLQHIRLLWRDLAKTWIISARATTTPSSSRQTAGPSTRPSPTSSGTLISFLYQHSFHTRPSGGFHNQRVLFFSFSQKEYSAVSGSGERHLYSEGHAEARRYHPLCVWSPQHHKHLRKSLPSSANRIPHEEPASQALRHCRELWDPAEQQLWTRHRLSRLCYQVFFFSLFTKKSDFRFGSLPLGINHKTWESELSRNWNGLAH